MSARSPNTPRWGHRAVTVLSAVVMLCCPKLGSRLARWSRRMRTRIGFGLARIARRVTACEDQLERDDDARGGQ